MNRLQRGCWTTCSRGPPPAELRTLYRWQYSARSRRMLHSRFFLTMSEWPRIATLQRSGRSWTTRSWNETRAILLSSQTQTRTSHVSRQARSREVQVRPSDPKRICHRLYEFRHPTRYAWTVPAVEGEGGCSS